jgi:hypothetical protein
MHALKAYGGVELRLHLLLTPALDGGRWKASLSGRFYPRGKSLLDALNRKLYEPQSRSWLLGDKNFEKYYRFQNHLFNPLKHCASLDLAF